jgi:predicted helicase
MRYNLLKTFDKIYIFDLHGDVEKNKTSPGGKNDTNVFNIPKGVSINIFVKSGHKAKNTLAEVFHYDMYGERADKFNFLSKNNLKDVHWQKLEPHEPQYFFVPKDFSLLEEYSKGFGIQELFQVNSVGVVTGKDCVFVNVHEDALLKNMRKFLDTNPDNTLVQRIDYRPFDTRYIYFDAKKIARARENVMQHLLFGENVGLIFKRGFTEDAPPVFVSTNIINFRLWSRHGMQGGDYIAPLYLYPEPAFQAAGDTRRPNLNEAIIGEISRLTKLRFTAEKETAEKTFAPIDVLDYIYGVLHSAAYRERYKEFLKIDFPRVPYPESAKDFRTWAAFGGKLRRLHLMEDVEPKEGIANFPVRGSNEVENLKYADGKVFINGAQYFNRVPPEAWVFYIGGYQPAQKWLKDRKGQALNHKDVEHYQKIVRVLLETEKLMRNK